MHRYVLPLLALLLLLSAPRAEESSRPAVLIVSVDGLRPDALDATETPTFDRLRKEGAGSSRAQTIFPSATLPSHTSMLTGQPPRTHGIIVNSWHREAGYITIPTCLSIASKAGMRTVMVVTKKKLTYLARPETVDRFERTGRDADAVKRLLADIEANGPADLTFLHLRDPDSTGHRHGWMSNQQLAAVRRVDRLLGRLLKALDDRRVTLIVTSDHGGHARTHGSRRKVDMTIPWIAWGRGVKKGHNLETDIVTMDTAATALHCLSLPIPENWAGRPIKEAFQKEKKKTPSQRDF